MNEATSFRNINQTEKRIIEQSLSKIEHQIISIINKIEYSLFISFNNLNSKRYFLNIYLVPNYLTKIFENIKSEIIINSAGIYFGFIKKNVFFLSLEGAEFLYNLNSFSDKYFLIVNDEGEKAILYGNKIAKRFIHQIPSNLKKKDFLLILNTNKELLSLAQSMIDYLTYQNLKPDYIAALNLIDKGYYLRKKQ